MAELGLGMQTLLRSGVSGEFPFSYAETPEGLLLLANGVDPMLKWDGQSDLAETAGVQAPTTAIALGGIGPGYIVGKFVAYQRFLDDQGDPSDLSPVSNLMDTGTDGNIDDITFNPTSGAVTVRSPDHGLTGTQAVVISGVVGFPITDGSYNITVVDKDTFAVQGVVSTFGLYERGGSWRTGVSQVVYSSVSPPTDMTVVRRQILRNLSGNLDTLYVDIDTDDLFSTTFSSTKTDGDLIQGLAVPLYYGEDELPFANRNGIPPSHKSVLCSHKGRVYAAVDNVYRKGHVEPHEGNTLVQGVGTSWRTTFVGRQIFIDDSPSHYSIESVDETNQTLILSTPYANQKNKFCFYTIRPAPAERRLIYWSEAGRPESWPAYNSIAIPETNDEIVGLFSLGAYLYVVERRHIHRYTFQGDPQDGSLFLASTRGSISNRTYVIVEDKVYFLDEVGIHVFDGQASKSISLPVQNLFQEDGTSAIQVDWNADQTLWHAAHDPARDTIRWFISIVGSAGLFDAVCYNYRTNRFWLESYPCSISASTNATIGCRRSVAGTDARRVLCLGQGFYDGVDGTGTTRSLVTTATATTLTDNFATFAAVEGAAVAIVEGTGAGQIRIIATVTDTTLEVIDPWDITPDDTSVYQIGGIPWYWRSGWFRFLDHEEDLSRDVELAWRPTSLPALTDVRLYFDHGVDPRTWARDIHQDGVRTKAGDSYIHIDMDRPLGWARQRLSSHAGQYSFGDTWISAELSGVQAGAPIVISQVVLNDVES